MTQAPPPRAPDHDQPSAPTPRRPTPRASRHDRRLGALLRPDQQLHSWTRGWVSRAGPWRTLVAARTLDYVVLTQDHLYLFTTGFFTRLPRRCVLATALDRLETSERKARRGRHLVLSSTDHRTLLIDVRATFRGSRLADLLLARTSRPTP